MAARANRSTQRVMVFFTGGTITMTPRTGALGVVPSDEFERLFAELRPHLPAVQVEPVLWSNLPSPHVTPEIMFRLAQDIDRALARTGVCGAVVLHGTDVLVESAYMAHLTLRTRKPVVFTGAMRYYSETGFDGIRNLLNGIKACVLPLPPSTGVVLLMTDRIFGARDVIKVHSLNVDAFEAPECGPVAYVAGEDVRLTHAAGRSLEVRRPLVRAERIDCRVPLVSCYSGMQGEAVGHLLRTRPSGLVVEGFGAGNVPPGIVPAIDRAVARGLPVVLTTRCPEGGVWPLYAYAGGAADLAARGVILAGRLSAPKARIKLMVALGAGCDLPAVRRLFEKET